MVSTLDFAVIGVQKSATTWLNDCLKEHPGINMKSSKNEDFYYGGPTFEERGEDWYFGLFRNGNGVRGCASVDYIMDDESPRKLHELNPNMKILVSLRNPKDRLASAYYWYVRKGIIPNIEIDEGLESILDRFEGNTPMQGEDLVQRGMYSDRLKRFLEFFPAKQIKVVFYDDIRRAPLETLQSVFAFLDIDANFAPNNLHSTPKKTSQTKWIMSLQRLAPKSKLMGKLADFLHRKSGESKSSNKNPSGTHADRLAEIYRNELDELSALINNQWGCLSVDPKIEW